MLLARQRPLQQQETAVPLMLLGALVLLKLEALLRLSLLLFLVVLV